MRRRILAFTLAILWLTSCGCAVLEEPGPDPGFLYGGWSDPEGPEGNQIRFRVIRTRLPGVVEAEYNEGRIEVLDGSPLERTTGVWNFGYLSPVVILNVVFEGEANQQWASVEQGPDRASLWIAGDASAIDEMVHLQPADWMERFEQRGLRRDLHRLDAEWNPEPKLTREESRLPAEAIILN